MKFNCDYFKDRRERIENERLEHFKNWHRKFCWFPTKIAEKDCRWLEFVERKYPNAYLSYNYGEFAFGKGFRVEYRPITKEISKEIVKSGTENTGHR